MYSEVKTDSSEVKKEKFNPGLDLCPLEHILIGSSTRLENGSILNSNVLKTDKDIATNRDLLLKPNGLRLNTSTQDEITHNRQEQKALRGWPACFRASERALYDQYEFDFLLADPSNGLIPNEFLFQPIIVRGVGDFAPLNISGTEATDALQKISLSPKLEPLFSLDRNLDTGVLTLKFLPLLKHTNQ